MMIYKSLLAIIVAAALLTACGDNREQKKSRERISSLETQAYGDTVQVLDPALGMEMIQAYTDYANAYPEDTLSAEYLFKGAEIAMNMKMAGLAIDTYKRILSSYPAFSKSDYCIFLQAFILENQLEQFDEAKALYEEFVRLYPDHPMADDARLSIQNMGIPLEELVRMWEVQAEK
ncbi:MAG: tetratricopeptide repeat protein [Bacteroidales bacterium]|jgi:TolA-binding protein